MTRGYRVGFWFVAVLFISAVVAHAYETGQFGMPTLIPILAGAALFRDWKIRQARRVRDGILESTLPTTAGAHMTDEQPSAAKPEKSFLSFFAWWNQSAVEIEQQARDYESRRVWKSARGVSALLCTLCGATTLVFGKAVGLSNEGAFLEAVVWSLLGVLMYRGHRWAFILSMVLWTMEKAAFLFDSPKGMTLIVQGIWWAIYMNFFFLGFKVEGRRLELRKAQAVSSAAPPDRPGIK